MEKERKFQMGEKETIWKPPESVRRARGQFINSWRPPTVFNSSAPGRSARWYVFPKIIWQPRSSSWSHEIPLIVPTPTQACYLPLNTYQHIFDDKLHSHFPENLSYARNTQEFVHSIALIWKGNYRIQRALFCFQQYPGYSKKSAQPFWDSEYRLVYAYIIFLCW